MSETTSYITRIEQDRTIASATPPTPDRAAVREAVIELLGYARSPQIARLSESLGLGRYVGKGTERHRVCHRIADALLAAVSRPAEARGEAQTPVWMLMDEVGACMPLLYPDEQSAKRAAESHSRSGKRWVSVKAFLPAAPRPETGEVSEAMVDSDRQGK